MLAFLVFVTGRHVPTLSLGFFAWVSRNNSVTFSASGRGTVHSWIVSRHPTDPDDAARIVALIDLEEGVRLVSNLADVDTGGPAGVTNGMAVEVVFRDVDGTRLPQFVPAGAAA